MEIERIGYGNRRNPRFQKGTKKMSKFKAKKKAYFRSGM